MGLAGAAGFPLILVASSGMLALVKMVDFSKMLRDCGWQPNYGWYSRKNLPIDRVEFVFNFAGAFL